MPEIEDQTPDTGLQITSLETVSRAAGVPHLASFVDETTTRADSEAHPQIYSMGEPAPPDRPSAFDMTQMSTNLPHEASANAGFSRGPSLQHHQNPQHMLDQVPQMAQYAHPSMPSHYYSPGQHMSHYYNEGASHRPGLDYYHQPQVAMSSTHAGYYYQQPPANYHLMGNVIPQQRAQGIYGGTSQQSSTTYPNTNHDAASMIGPSRPSSNRQTETSSGAVLGPPSKPQQSDHAIWIGNLPPQTDLMSLVQHVCKETVGLQSLFLISKSNCAFANYREAAESVAAQQKVHESRFQSVRLVSRLRNSASENTLSQAAASDNLSGTPDTPSSSSRDSPAEAGESIESENVAQNTSTNAPQSLESAPKQDKFFILKSLTIKDLDKSVQNGVWATQSHNESVLNNAFEDQKVDNVFLIFSANKSGEYFGYARMLSQMDQDPAAAIEVAASVQSSSYTDAPRIIWTEATESMPRGKIVDDSARGNIFWEVVVEEPEAGAEPSGETSNSTNNADQEPRKTWGKPFKLEWLSTTRLPFHRCRGLRNPWNANREVKIARDGTELEPSVGRKLIGLFNSVHTPGPMAPGGMMRGPLPPMGPMGGYHHNMRPYGQ